MEGKPKKMDPAMQNVESVLSASVLLDVNAQTQ